MIVGCGKLNLSEGGDAALQEQTIQWHPGFYAGLELELKGYHLDFESEHELTRVSATSIVATPHRGDRSFSVDLTNDEISATGGHRLFARSSLIF